MVCPILGDIQYLVAGLDFAPWTLILHHNASTLSHFCREVKAVSAPIHCYGILIEASNISRLSTHYSNDSPQALLDMRGALQA